MPRNLDAAAAYVDRAMQSAGGAIVCAEANPAQAEHMARMAKQAAESALGLLLAEGAQLGRLKGAGRLAPVALHQLDTPDTRALLAGLEALLPIAERIDAARGRAWSEPVGGSAGWDLAEQLAQLLARVSLEVRGPDAAVTGARE